MIGDLSDALVCKVSVPSFLPAWCLVRWSRSDQVHIVELLRKRKEYNQRKGSSQFKLRPRSTSVITKKAPWVAKPRSAVIGEEESRELVTCNTFQFTGQIISFIRIIFWVRISDRISFGKLVTFNITSSLNSTVWREPSSHPARSAAFSGQTASTGEVKLVW